MNAEVVAVSPDTPVRWRPEGWRPEGWRPEAQ
jgi:hypothetical protein